MMGRTPRQAQDRRRPARGGVILPCEVRLPGLLFRDDIFSSAPYISYRQSRRPS